MKYSIFIFFVIAITSCAKKEDTFAPSKLEKYLSMNPFEEGKVIACAASDEEGINNLVFFYNKKGASDIRLYESDSVQLNKKDYSQYKFISTITEPVFNEHLRKFSSPILLKEKWAIVTFEIGDTINISNPIRLKYISKPTVWSDSVTIDQSKIGKPKFTWRDNAFVENEIYFEVVSDEKNNLLSGTYTYDNFFQYYKTANVVLNVTIDTPPSLLSKSKYGITVMDISIDNWVNGVFIKDFIAK